MSFLFTPCIILTRSTHRKWKNEDLIAKNCLRNMFFYLNVYFVELFLYALNMQYNIHHKNQDYVFKNFFRHKTSLSHVRNPEISPHMRNFLSIETMIVSQSRRGVSHLAADHDTENNF